MLTAEVIETNYKKFMERIDLCFPTRSESLKRMYSELGEERTCFAPASSTDYFHNAFPGGYIDHILRVMNFSLTTFAHWQTMGLDTDNFTKEELLFTAMHHDLGKLGLPGDGRDMYVKNHSEWHIKNQGKIYTVNENIPNMTVQDRSLYLLQSFGIPCTFNEWLGIKIHDGMYDEANHQYLSSYSLQSKPRSNLVFIIHHADMMASRFEFERWNKSTNSLNTNTIDTPLEFKLSPKEEKQKIVKSIHQNLANEFKDIFK